MEEISTTGGTSGPVVLDGSPVAGSHVGDWPDITHPAASIDGAELKSNIPRSNVLPLAAWHVVGGAGEPAFGANWYALYATNPTLTVPVAFRLDSIAQYVELCGIMACSGAAGTPFTLPTGFRPAGTVYPACGFYDASASTRLGFQLEVRATGQVVVAPGVVPASGDLVYFDNIRIPVA